MRKSRFTVAQIVGIVKESEAGANAGEFCRRHGISETTLCKWKSKFSAWQYLLNAKACIAASRLTHASSAMNTP